MSSACRSARVVVDGPDGMRWILPFLLFACGAPPVHSSITEAQPVELPAEWVDCRQDSDCVALEMGCCDHCNGGWVVAVNRAHVTRATGAYHQACDSYERTLPDGNIEFCGPSCTELGCGGIGQRCSVGRCVWTWDAGIEGVYHDQPNVVLPARMPHGPACNPPQPSL
jgi:hypothetical protein